MKNKVAQKKPVLFVQLSDDLNTKLETIVAESRLSKRKIVTSALNFYLKRIKVKPQIEVNE